MSAESVKNDDVSRPQCPAKKFEYLGKKLFAILRPVGYQRRTQLPVAQCAYKGGDFPMPVRARSDAALPPRGTSVAPRHAGRGPGFIHKHELCDVPISRRVSLHARRAACTSARSCALACKVFFEGDIPVVQRVPQSADLGRHALLRQPLLQPAQGKSVTAAIQARGTRPLSGSRDRR